MKIIKSVSFNDKNKDERAMLKHIKEVGFFSEYVKKLIWMDILKPGNVKNVVLLNEIKDIDYKNIYSSMSKSRIYKIWRGMLQRCNNEKSKGYEHYGGRGISVEWESFEDFADDMYDSYIEHVIEFGERDTTIERVNNDGNYSLNNCKWATHKEQSRNRRKPSRKK